MTIQTADSTSRHVVRIVPGMPASDGAGVRLSRIIGQPALPDLDPFLLLDEFRSEDANDYLAGFPEHPHRGFETVTYMLAGRMRHRDSKGNSGLLTPGSVQWMTAGSGILHSEMPEQEDGLMWGFQLWVNLPAKNKMISPRYQDIGAQHIPEVARDGSRVRIIAGRFEGGEGPVQAADTDPTYLDISLETGATFRTFVPAAHDAFVYALDGTIEAGDASVPSAIACGEVAVLSRGDKISVRAPGAARFLLVAGQPLGEPIARYGPIVMNTKAELAQAFDDLQNGRF